MSAGPASPTKRAGDRRAAVSVHVRVRPFLEGQRQASCVDVVPGACQLILTQRSEKPKAYSFDSVLGSSINQEHIYNLCVRPLLLEAIAGYNATVLAYGQTGSGKTYTMGTCAIDNLPDTARGIAPRFATELFQILQDTAKLHDGRFDFVIRATYVEIYQEQIRDLIQPPLTTAASRAAPVDIQIREDKEGSINLSSVHEETCHVETDILRILEMGSRSRTTGDTRMNDASSRSHAIFSVSLEQRYQLKNNQFEIRQSKFHLVDLAGSERQKRTGAEGIRLKESVKINSGLLALGNVISALGIVNRAPQGSDRHVPYRESKLTRMLQDSLGGNSKTIMIACISPMPEDYAETLNTLVYANRAKNIKNKPLQSQHVVDISDQENEEFAIPSQTEIAQENTVVRTPQHLGKPLYTQLEASLEQVGALVTEISQENNNSQQTHMPIEPIDTTALVNSLRQCIAKATKRDDKKLSQYISNDSNDSTEHLPAIRSASSHNLVSMDTLSPVNVQHIVPHPPAERARSANFNRSLTSRRRRALRSVSSIQIGHDHDAFDIQDLQAKIRQLEQDMHTKDHQMEKQIFKATSSQTELIRKSASINSLTRHAADLETDLTNNARELNEYRTRNGHLVETVARQEATIVQYTNQLTELAADLKAEKRTAQTQVNVIEELQHGVDHFKTYSNRLEQENREFTKKIELLDTNLADQQSISAELEITCDKLAKSLQEASTGRSIGDSNGTRRFRLIKQDSAIQLSRSQSAITKPNVDPVNNAEPPDDKQEDHNMALDDITSELESKLSEFKQIEKNQKRQSKVASKFADKIALLEKELTQTTKEVETLRSERSNSDAEKNKLKYEYENKIAGIHAEMEKLKFKQREYEKTIRDKGAAEKKLQDLRSEIDRLMVQQATHKRRTKDDADKLQNSEGLRNKEVGQLQKKIEEEQRRVKQLEQQLAAQRKKMDKQAEHQHSIRPDSGKERQRNSKHDGPGGTVELQETIQMMQTDNDKLRGMIESLERTVQTTTETYESQVRDMRVDYEDQIRHLSARTPQDGGLTIEKQRELKLRLRALVAQNIQLASALDAEQQKNQAFMDVAMQLDQRNSAHRRMLSEHDSDESLSDTNLRTDLIDAH